MRLAAARGANASDAIVAEVRAALFRGDLKPGDHLGSEADLARQMGLSRVPVRDAFRSLQAMGIIEVRVGAGGGARIAAGDPRRSAEALAVQFKLVGLTAEELFESQSIVEPAAARLAARNATAADMERMASLLERLAASLDDGPAFTRLGLEFHRAIVEASQNRALVAQSVALIDVLYEAYAPQTDPERASRVLKKHRRLFALIRRGDGEAAARAMSRHLSDVRRSALRTISRGSGSFPLRTTSKS